MVMTPARTVLTYRDYAALPDDGRRYEIHEGELSVTPAPATKHQRLIRKLLVALDAYVSVRRLGEVFVAPYDVILSDTTVVQPDIVYVATDRLGLISERGIEGPPTLSRVWRHPAAMPQYEVGHLEHVAALEARLARLPGLVLAGSAYRGVGISDCVRSGEEAAERALGAREASTLTASAGRS